MVIPSPDSEHKYIYMLVVDSIESVGHPMKWQSRTKVNPGAIEVAAFNSGQGTFTRILTGTDSNRGCLTSSLHSPFYSLENKFCFEVRYINVI
jgi:hypothetical protein